MEIKEYKKAVSEIKASEEKKEAIIGTLVAQTSSTSKEVKHVFTKKHAVMAAFTIVLLCIVIIPVSLFFAPSYRNASSQRRRFYSWKTYTRIPLRRP